MKKIMRKGFTLVELLVVLTVIGILSTMFTISGREASNIARANKIAEDFKIISAAMNMYYSDNTDACNITTANKKDGQTEMKAETILAALNGYLKSTTYIEAEASAQEGKFHISIEDDASWWLTYKLPTSNLQIARILANKALQEGFVTTVKLAVNDTNKYVATEASAGSGTLKSDAVSVCYQVR